MSRFSALKKNMDVYEFEKMVKDSQELRLP